MGVGRGAGLVAVVPEVGRKLRTKPCAAAFTCAVGTPVSPITVTRMLLPSNGATVTEAIPGAGLSARNALPPGKRNLLVITSAKKV